jgi:chromosome segregation ATPase
MDVDARLAELYGGSPDGFVAARDALVRELRAEGRRDEAAAVKARRKPKRVAWALDAARLQDPPAVDELADAVESVREAQTSGGDVREALGRLRAAERTVVDAAVAATRSHDRPVDHAQLGVALRAVAAEPGAMAELRAGVLADTPDASSFGEPVAHIAAPPARPPSRAKARDRAEPRATGTQRRERASAGGRGSGAVGSDAADIAAAREAVAAADKAAKAAAREVRSADTAADKADRRARDAEIQAATARRNADERLDAADKARQEAERATAARDEAVQELADARAALERLLHDGSR